MVLLEWKRWPLSGGADRLGLLTMLFQPNLIRFPTQATESARFSSVLPRLSVGMVFSALVLSSGDNRAVVRMRGMDIDAHTQVPLRADQQVSLVVTDLSKNQVVFRVMSDMPSSDMALLTDDDLRPILIDASLPADRDGFAALRALIGRGKALNSATVTALVTSARAVGNFTQSTLDAIIFLQDRGLPVTLRSVELANVALAGGGDPSSALSELEQILARARAVHEGNSHVRKSGMRQQSGGLRGSDISTLSLPPKVVIALERLVRLFPRLDLRPNPSSPVDVTPNTRTLVPSSNDFSGKLHPEPSADRNQPAQSLPPTSSRGPGMSRLAAGADISRQIARLVARIGTTLEAQIVKGSSEVEPSDPRLLIAKLDMELESARGTATSTERGRLDLVISALRGLSDAVESSQMLNAAPRLRDESGAYLLFQLPIRTVDGWDSGDLRIYRRHSSDEIDANNVNVLLRLNMRYLGSLDVAITVKEGRVSCDFRYEDSDVADVFEANSDSLVSSLEGIGHPVNSINHQLILSSQVTGSSPPLTPGHIDARA